MLSDIEPSHITWIQVRHRVHCRASSSPTLRRQTEQVSFGSSSVVSSMSELLAASTVFEGSSALMMVLLAFSLLNLGAG